LYRPGPMEAIPALLAARNSGKAPRYEIPQLGEILDETSGSIVYQEQVMQIFQQLAGYSLGQADMVRRAMSKKKVKDIEKEREAFLHGDPARGITGCVANGIPEQAAQSIYDEMYDFANYAFNKAHAVAYAVVAWQTAYFKCHFPKEYMAALLSSVLDNSDKVGEYIAECKECRIPILPPDVNHSCDSFTVEEGGIRFGLVAIKNIGRGFIQSVMREREKGGLFRSFQDFCERMIESEMNKRALENLIYAGAFDSFGNRRSQLIQVYEKVLDGIAADRRQNVEGQFDLFGGVTAAQPKKAGITMPDVPEFARQFLMSKEKESVGIYISGHPMDSCRGIARAKGAAPLHAIMESFEEQNEHFRDGQKIAIAGVVTSSKTKTTRNNSLMAYVVLEDGTGSMEMICFSRTLENCGSYLREGQVILARGRLSAQDEKAPQLMCDYAEPLEIPAEGEPVQEAAPAAQAKPVTGKTLYLRVPSLKSREMRRVELLLQMFEGDSPLKIRVADTGKLLGSSCLLYPSFLQELKEQLGEENVVLK
ncbi:MAG: DNA polymerase III subunit alpha, partial [Oscillospiraceae bacterium]|nr:DNA polymerase III subunit alpha [Oscillospiraceae bacterium]